MEDDKCANALHLLERTVQLKGICSRLTRTEVNKHEGGSGLRCEICGRNWTYLGSDDAHDKAIRRNKIVRNLSLLHLRLG